jgi:hypothetical protein
MMAAHVATARHVPPRTLVALALAIALLPPATTSIGIGVAGAFTIEGFVVDPEHRPVGGVIVSLEGTDHATTTDSLGVFQLRDVAPGTYALSVRGECTISGYVSRVQVPNLTARTCTLAEGSPVPIRSEGAEPGGEFRIRVCLTTPDGRTALVHLMRLGSPPPEFDVLLADRALLTFSEIGGD